MGYMRKPLFIQNIGARHTMRYSFIPQMSIGSIPIHEIEFDIYTRHELTPVLMALQHLYAHRMDIINEICRLIQNDIIDHQDERFGCTGLSYWEILILASVRLGCNLDYDQLSDLADNHDKLRKMFGLSPFDIKRYPRSTINDNLTCLSPKTIDAISALVVDEGHRLCPKAVDSVRGDSYVVQRNIHYPTDINLLFDGIRKIIELTIKITKSHKISGWRKHKYLLKKAKGIRRKIEKIARSKQKEKEKKLETLYTELIVHSQDIVDRALVTLHNFQEMKKNANESISDFHNNIVSEIHYFISGTEYVADLAERRMLKKEDIPNSDKVFSLFEPATELINRGKRPYPIEFGHRVLLIQDSSGFIIHSHVMDIGLTDEKVIVDVMLKLQKRFNGKIRAASFDKGFWTPNNLKDLSEIIKDVFLPKKGKRSKIDKLREESKEFLKSRKWHPGIESAIHALGVGNGLIVCRDKDFKRYVALGVLGRNLHSLGTILMEKERLRRKSFQRAA